MPLTVEQHLSAHQLPKRMLALDGGGLRGVIALEYLDVIEKELCARYGGHIDFRLCDYFDLIGGTSTGAIIAAGLACGMSVAEIKALYRELGEHVFERGIFPRGLLSPKFPSERVQQALDAYLGADTTFGDDRIRTGLMVMTKRLDTGGLWPIHNHPSARYGTQDRQLRLAQVVRASTAAPTYFSPERITISSPNGTTIDGAFVDGGVSPFNDPALQLMCLAALEGHGFRWEIGADKLLLVSVGTGSDRLSISTDSVMNSFAAKQGIVALQSLLEDCGRVNKMMLQWLTRCLTPWTIDRALGDMALDMQRGPQLATYVRYDVNLDPDWLRTSLNLDWSSERIADMAQMDRPENMSDLAELGRLASSLQFRPGHLPPDFDLPSGG